MPKVTPELYKIDITETSFYPDKSEDESADKGGEFYLSQYKKFLSRFDGMDWIKFRPFDPDWSYNIYCIEETSYVVSRDQMTELCIRNIGFKVKQKISVTVDITEQLMELAQKPITIASNGGDTYNSKCEVHMPGNMMAMYNQVLLLENSCTDSLQCALNAGWRLIAACPQPDQRRPDYVLGRLNPEYTGDEIEALRKI